VLISDVQTLPFEVSVIVLSICTKSVSVGAVTSRITRRVLLNSVRIMSVVLSADLLMIVVMMLSGLKYAMRISNGIRGVSDAVNVPTRCIILHL
jgi:hypothetical protein